MRHNNVLPNGHFHKDWQRRVKTWFDQPGQKKRRRVTRLKKAATIAPRPLDLLRPAVRCPTLKYNMKLRMGRGFTFEEIKAAGIRRKEALSFGIPIDHRRRNRSVESLEMNVQRLNEYKQKMILFPKKGKKATDALATSIATATQFKGVILPIINDITDAVVPTTISGESKVFAYQKLRQVRADKKYKGKREKIIRDKAEEEKNKNK